MEIFFFPALTIRIFYAVAWTIVVFYPKQYCHSMRVSGKSPTRFWKFLMLIEAGPFLECQALYSVGTQAYFDLV